MKEILLETHLRIINDLDCAYIRTIGETGAQWNGKVSKDLWLHENKDNTNFYAW